MSILFNYFSGRSDWREEFEWIDVILHPDSRVSIRSYHGTYLSTSADGTLTWNKETVGEEELWVMTRYGNKRISLRGCSNKYLSASPDGQVSCSKVGKIKETFFSLIIFVMLKSCFEGKWDYKPFFFEGCVVKKKEVKDNFDIFLQDSVGEWELFEWTFTNSSPSIKERTRYERDERSGSFSSTSSSVMSSTSSATFQSSSTSDDARKFRSRTIGLKQASDPNNQFR